MGSCVSVPKNPKPATTNRISAGSTNNEDVLVPSPVKEKPLTNGDGLTADVAVKARRPSTFRSIGSKDEIFFDSQAWLESDCEDDFHSVNGDFTPSRGNTPVHHSFSMPQHKVTIPDNPPVLLEETSPRKRLSELFKDSVREQKSDDQDVANNNNNNDKSVSANPDYSAERITNGGRAPDETSVRSTHCCLPRLHSSRTSSERKKKLSPRHSIS